MAPPVAAKAFYASISGSRNLPPPYDNFYTFPCMNPPVLEFGFGGSLFPFMQGGRAQQWTGLPGGRFSLGRLQAGSGYCIGAVVETRMGVRDEKGEVLDQGRRGTRPGVNQEAMGGNGMRDVWVIGEGFFRGVGGVFDVCPDCSSRRVVFLLINRTTVQGELCWVQNVLKSKSTCFRASEHGIESIGGDQTVEIAMHTQRI